MSIPLMKIDTKVGELNPCKKCKEVPNLSASVNMETNAPFYVLICPTRGCKSCMINEDNEELFKKWNEENS